MPASYTIDRAHGVVFSRVWGVVTVEDANEHDRLLLADPDFDPNFCQLVDLRSATHIALKAEVVRTAARVRLFHPGRPRAFVGSDEEQYGMARMYAIFSEMEGQRVAVFREWADALQWLILTADLPVGSRPG